MINGLLRSLLIVCLAVTQNLSAQVQLVATSTATHLAKGERVRVTYMLEGAEGRAFEAPNFAGFEQVGGVMVQNNIRVTNGITVRSQRYSYDLEAVREGTLTIAPATIRVNGQTVESNTLKLVVGPPLEQSNLAPKGDELASLRIVVEKDSVYVGEGLPIRIDLYTRMQAYSYDLLRELDLYDFHFESLRRFDTRTRQVEVDGEPYLVKTLLKYVAYPRRSGRYKIGPMAARIALVTGERRRSYFGQVPTQVVDVRSDAVELTVLPVPVDAPAGYTEAVGRWRFHGQYQDTVGVTTADAITFKLFVQGRGDATRLEAPELDWPQGWQVFSTETSLEQAVESDTGAVYTKVFDYVVAPTRGGTNLLAPQASYFDTELGEYVVWQAKPLPLVVEDVGGGVATAGGASEDVVGPYLGRPRVVRPVALLEGGWFWGMVAAGPLLWMLAVCGRMLWGRVRSRRHVADRDDAVRQAWREAEAALADPVAFYAAVRVWLERFAERRLGLPPSQQSPEHIHAAFGRLGEDAAGRADRFLEVRELVGRGLYGGGIDEAGRRELLGELGGW